MRHTKLGVVIVILLVLSCGRGLVETKRDVFNENSTAQWIGDREPLPVNDSLYYLDQPAPLFRKEIRASSPIRHARLYITAAGYYRASLNGKEIGKNVLDPAWTDFSKRIYYTEYDITSLLKVGDNCLGVSLGNGFYNPLPLMMWGRRNLRENLKVGKPVFIAKVQISYEDGSSEEIISDKSWKYAYGPLIKNSVYLGVAYDARKEIKGWNTAGFNDASWANASIGHDPGGELQAAFFPPVQVTREIRPSGITSPEPGLYLVDMGQVFTGTYQMKVSGTTGDTLVFRFGERIYPDGTLNPMTTVIGQIKQKGQGGPGAPEIAWQSDQYVLGDNPEASFTPPFTYHTYRYIEIKGLEKAPEISDIKGLFIHSNLIAPNSFSCSSELLNAIQQATVRTFRANLVSVQSDCAAREKFGYGGDVNATSESFICNFDMQTFYRKTIYDWVDAMKDSSFVDTAPFVGIEYCGISWESAFLITQYYLYLYYNDTAIIDEFYELDKQWMDKVALNHPNGMVDKGLSDHESLEPVPVQLTGTGHYLQCARIMNVFASVMNDTAGARRYEELTDRLEGMMKEEFWDKSHAGEINRQTLFSTLLYHGIIPEEDIAAASDSLLASVRRGPSGHITAGIFGTKYILETLSRYASPELVFDMVNSTAYPGWGFMIDRGATTIWETWKESDNTYSNCHPMFGSITEWYYRWLGGIRPDPEHPGFKEFVLAPSVPDGLDSVQCAYHSPYGQIKSSWRKVEENTCRYEMTIPEGSRARVSLSLDPHQSIKMKRNQESVDSEYATVLPSGRFTLPAGDYIITVSSAQDQSSIHKVDNQDFDPSRFLWYETPAENWEEALPVGNGRLGAMVFGNYGEERVQLNEETYWSGGPYSTVVEGGADALPEIQKLIFEGEPVKAHKLFGRKLMGSPVEQQKYQSLANLHLFFPDQDQVSGYKRWLDLNSGVTGVEYTANKVRYYREVISSAPDQVILVRLTASKPGSISFKAQLRGCRNQAHSNYATDYFAMDGVEQDGLMVNGKSADYLGIEGRIRYKAQLKAIHEGGNMWVDEDVLIVENADAVTLCIAAATNFVNYKDVSADQEERVAAYLKQIIGKSYYEMSAAAVKDYQKYFERASLNLPESKSSYLPTDKRLEGIVNDPDPGLASLCYNFARYILISSSRPGTQPANLQGIWNENMNPAWDSKYTTNINTEMNYWPAGSGNLWECIEPLLTMVKELTDQGAQVAKEHYGADGWVFHQNTDLWRVAAPMDGPCWGTFTVGGAWLTNQLYDHYLFTQESGYLEEIYPLMEGAVRFFLDFLVEDPDGKWLVTNPSTSPENPPKGPGYEYFFDEVTGFYYFTTICYGSSIDIQILSDLFANYVEMGANLGRDQELIARAAEARKRLSPPQIGKDGTLQEWSEDMEQLEDKHRHFSHLYGLYPGNVISAKRTPQYVDACKAVLNQRGDGGKGFSMGWKMALWARLYDGNRANKVFKGYLQEQCYPQLFARCGTPLQMDGTMGVAAGITEMLLQSHEGVIDLLPALPDEWHEGRFEGVCARGGFELNMEWKNKSISEVELLSKAGNTCRIAAGQRFTITEAGKKIHARKYEDGSIEFETAKGGRYILQNRLNQ